MFSATMNHKFSRPSSTLISRRYKQILMLSGGEGVPVFIHAGKNLLQLIVLLFLFILPQITYAQISFEKNFGGSAVDVGAAVRPTSDGGFIIVGETKSYGDGSYNVYLIKTNASGDTLWTKKLGENIYIERGFSIQQTLDNGYIITGEYQSNRGIGGTPVVLILKTDAAGIVTWDRKFGGNGADRGNSVQLTTDGGYIIVGYTNSYGAGDSDVWLLKTNATGDTSWTKTFGGSLSEWGNDVQQTQDGGYIITGTTETWGTNSSFDLYLVKTDASGNEQWSKTFGGDYWDEGFAVEETAGGGYIICGFSDSFGDGSGDVYLVKTDPAGIETWSKSIGGSDFTRGVSLQSTSDGGYIIAGDITKSGMNNPKVYLLKTKANGDTLWSKMFGGTGYDYGKSVREIKEDEYIVAGYTESFGVGGDVFLIRIDTKPTGIDDSGLSNFQPEIISLSQNYPNPFNPSTLISYQLSGTDNVSLKIFDVSGKLVRTLVQGQQTAGSHSVLWNGRDETGLIVSSGLYIYRLGAGDQVMMKRMLLMK